MPLLPADVMRKSSFSSKSFGASRSDGRRVRHLQTRGVVPSAGALLGLLVSAEARTLVRPTNVARVDVRTGNVETHLGDGDALARFDAP